MTSITLDTPTTGGPPAVKFPEVGTSVVVGIVNVDEYHQHNIDGVAQTWSDGTPKMGKRVTGLVVASEGAVVGGERGDQPVQPGDLVTFYCEGGRHYTWRDAVAEAGGVNVGDVMRWAFDHEEPAKQRGFNPRKVYVAKIRRPEERDGDLADRCVAAYHEAQARPALDAPQPTAPQAAQDDLSSPF
jgi:hypothetical protein